VSAVGIVLPAVWIWAGRNKMLSVGIDTHEREHYVEIQNEKEETMWRGRIRNNREGLQLLLEKIKTVERSNVQEVIGIFINPTGNYHIPVKYFLENSGFSGKVFMVDARRTVNQRKIMNLGKEKSDPEDAHILAATPWRDKKYGERAGHVRDDLSELTRMREIINTNITRLVNYINADLQVVFPEFTDIFSIDSKTGMAILENYTTPDNLYNIRKEKLLTLMKKEGRNHYSTEDSDKLIEMARNSIGVPDRNGVFTFRIRINVERLRSDISFLKRVEKEIGKMSKGNLDISNITEMKGIGNINAATIVSEIGDIKQFESVVKLQSYGGKCPDMTGSGGKSHAKKLTKIRNEHLSNAIHQSAVSLVNHRNREFYELFSREIRKGKTNTEAYIVVGKRLLFHVFSIMKNKKPYRERISKEGRPYVSTGMSYEQGLRP
jgi:transposase